MASIDQQFIEYIVKELVGHPDDVIVERRIDEKGVLLELTVNPEDLGRVIGKRGVTAQSLRSLLRALGTKNDARYNLKIINNDQPGAVAPSSSTPAQDNTDDDTNDDDTDDDVLATPDHQENQTDDEEPKKESDLAKNTRQELAELDDLDV